MKWLKWVGLNCKHLIIASELFQIIKQLWENPGVKEFFNLYSISVVKVTPLSLSFLRIYECLHKYRHSILMKILVGNFRAKPRLINFVHYKYEILFKFFSVSFSITFFLTLLSLSHLQRKCTDKYLPFNFRQTVGVTKGGSANDVTMFSQWECAGRYQIWLDT